MAEQDIQEERTHSDWTLLQRFIRFAHPYQPPLRNVYILYFINSVLNLIPAASLRYYFDIVVDPKQVSLFGWTIDSAQLLQTTGQKVVFFLWFGAAMIVLIVLANSIGVIMWRLGTSVSQRVILDIKRHIHLHLHKLSISYFDRARTGEIMSRVVGDVDQMETMLRQSFSMLYGMTHLFTAPLIMLGLCPMLFPLVLIPIPIIFIAVRRIRFKLRPLYRRMREQQADIGAVVQEHISGIREIKAFNKAKTAHRDYTRVNLDYVRSVLEAMRVFSVNHQVLYGTRDLALILVGVGGGMLAVVGLGNVTAGIVIAYIPLMNHFFMPVGQMVDFYDQIQRGLASADRVFRFLDQEPEVRDRSDARWMDLNKGTVRFENVTFGYDQDAPVLYDVSFDVASGCKVALVGGSGAGKTTLISLLLRFYQPQQGQILIDGQNIAELKLDALGQALGVVFQQTFLFYGTIAENIAFSRADATMTQIREAARMANIAGFIEDQPEGYDTMVGERGIKLSGGQCQRLAIARMILKDPTVVILDEATSAVDVHTERAIQESLNKLMQGRTAFIIAHRLSTIRNADLILVLEKGRLVEQGSHDELVALSGRYAEMVKTSVM